MRANKVSAILGNQREYQELLPLTAKRPLIMLPFDCKYRLIDFALSSMVNANINSVYMLFDQNKTKSAFDHLGSGREWHLDSIKSRYFIHFYQEILEKKAEGRPFFEDVIDYLKKSKSVYTVFFGNKMLCNVDLTAVLKIHQIQNNDITAVFKRVTIDKLSNADNVLHLQADGRILGVKKFREIDKSQDVFDLSMNIFVVQTDWLIHLLEEGQLSGAPSSIQDFLIEQLGKSKSSTYEYTGYLSNIFDLDSYYQANMDMLDLDIFNSLLESNQQVMTKMKNEVPTYFSATSDVVGSQFATGSIIKGHVNQSLVSRRSRVEEGARVSHSILLPGAKIHRDAVVEYAILDKNVTVNSGVSIVGTPDQLIVLEKNTQVIADIFSDELAIIQP